MARNHDETDRFEIVLAIVNPALVMGLVGSLAFFLLDVLHRGKYEDRLRWTLFFFVFGMVLVSRIALIMGSERGLVYGSLLAGVTYLAAAKYATGIGWFINFLIIGVIAVSSYILTRDTTWMGEAQAERGLAAELSEAWQLLPAKGSRARRGRHGRWVVYFSLAAVPLFAIGQSLIPLADVARRQYAFWLMTAYIGSALGLLLTSALVNLRAYLKSRKLKMPAAMTGLWLAVGLLLIIPAMAISAFVPRPHSETPLYAMRNTESPDRDASRFAADAENAGKGKGRAGGKRDDNADDGRSKSGQPDEKAKSQSDRGDKGDGGNQAKDQGKGKSADDSAGSGKDGSKSDATSENAPPPSPSGLDRLGEVVASVIKWIVWVAVALAIIYIVLRNLAGVSQSIRNWFDGLAKLFRRRQTIEIETSEADAIDEEILAPFSAFSNPFADGSNDRRDDVELVRYTFTALEAWARGMGEGRRVDETPLEFAERLDAEMRRPARRLAGAFSVAAYYDERRLPHASRDLARDLWLAMEQGAMARHADVINVRAEPWHSSNSGVAPT